MTFNKELKTFIVEPTGELDEGNYNLQVEVTMLEYETEVDKAIIEFEIQIYIPREILKKEEIDEVLPVEVPEDEEEDKENEGNN